MFILFHFSQARSQKPNVNNFVDAFLVILRGFLVISSKCGWSIQSFLYPFSAKYKDDLRLNHLGVFLVYWNINYPSRPDPVQREKSNLFSHFLVVPQKVL